MLRYKKLNYKSFEQPGFQRLPIYVCTQSSLAKKERLNYSQLVLTVLEKKYNSKCINVESNDV